MGCSMESGQGCPSGVNATESSRYTALSHNCPHHIRTSSSILIGLPVDSTLERCLHVLEDLYSGESIKEGNLELIVIQPDASYLSNQDKVSSAGSVEERVITTFSEGLMLNTSLFFEPPSQPQGFWLVLRQRLLKVQGNPILSLLEFPPTKDNVTLDNLFHIVREDENNVKVF